MSIVRKTKSVNIILSKFDKGHEALSVVDLVEELKEDMNKTTVYRVLDRLENDGTIHSFTGTNGLKWYAKCYQCTSHHHNDVHPHFECNACGKVECLDLNIAIPQIKNRNIETASIMLKGQCSDCMA
ncbi:Fur family transcriptional regulator [Winogradskyella sp.]|jgi:Fur family ferric uptake transcriptional regulator|uniref:Fur family transcriptional regulator n=1 Tax=Winogradskyella sp. TaxID=1883156 RepID=UPI0025CD6604|nr:transcriptional repressor [Winogradskyella sp.]MCT4630970.1 transcriptional repressor [Winogradskyella sp.]